MPLLTSNFSASCVLNTDLCTLTFFCYYWYIEHIGGGRCEGGDGDVRVGGGELAWLWKLDEHSTIRCPLHYARVGHLQWGGKIDRVRRRKRRKRLCGLHTRVGKCRAVLPIVEMTNCLNNDIYHEADDGIRKVIHNIPFECNTCVCSGDNY